MIDLHSHVLPGLDDGARTREESLAMLEAAAEAGTTDIVATPHADTRYRYDADQVEELIAELNAKMQGRIRVHSGCDFHLTHDNVVDALEYPRRYTVAHRAYLMVELSNLTIFPITGELFSHLEDAGLRIVVTHPERNPLLRQRPELLQEWVAAGRYLQLTAQSLTGHWGDAARQFCRMLLDRGWAHFVASDTHDVTHRPPTLQPAYAWLKEHYGEARARALLVENPGAALRGESLPQPRQQSRGWLSRVFG